ncbi:MAG: PstS family phosphate ABC transporter substrate-binding protein [Bacteroidales bacterium]|nr:PstS family phosphate ABC transporter substrate-binding protein [Bacteroidales bacterium]
MRKTITSIAAISMAAMLIAGATACGGRKKSSSNDSASNEISLSGAFALYPLAVKWAAEYQKLHPEVKIDISAGGAGKGITDALAGVVDFGMVSREIAQVELDKGAVPFAVAKDAVVPTINANNPALADLLKKGLTREAAHGLWIDQNITTWGQLAGTSDATPIAVYNRSDACGAAETWALWFDQHQEDLNGVAVFGDPGLAAAVQKDPNGIGFNNIGYAYDPNTKKTHDGLLVLPIDVNGNGQIDPEESFYDNKDLIVEAIANDRYPSPPARDLYLVSKGIPTNPVVIDFLRYVLTDGQKENVPQGYIGMSQEKVNRSLELLKQQK